jgi:hypothetical protein
MFDDATDAMMRGGEPPPFPGGVTQAGPVAMTAHPQIRVTR